MNAQSDYIYNFKEFATDRFAFCAAAWEKAAMKSDIFVFHLIDAYLFCLMHRLEASNDGLFES
jgi:hypothetical protein